MTGHLGVEWWSDASGNGDISGGGGTRMLGGCCLGIRGGVSVGEDPFTKNNHGVVRLEIQGISGWLYWSCLDEISFENT